MPKLNTGTIRARLLTGFILIALVPAIGATIGAVIVARINGQRQAIERLQSVAASKDEAIKRWANSVQQQLTAVSYSDCGYARLNVVVSLARSSITLNSYNQTIRNRFLGFLGQSGDLQEVFLTNPRGLILISTDLQQEGQSVTDIPGYTQGGTRAAIVLRFAAGPAGTAQGPSQVVVAAPVTGETPQDAGIIAARAGLDQLALILAEYTGLGKTGKSYLAAPDGSLLADSRLASSLAADSRQPFAPSAGMKVALEQKTTVYGVYQDYRGLQVTGIYRWLPELGVVLAVEQDQPETLDILTETLRANLLVALASLLVAVALSSLLVRGIVRPLAQLAETATQIADGDLERVAPVERQDEIGILANAFNSMTAQLRELIAGLEKRVADRTRDLERLTLQLETSARVGREATSILEVNELLGKTADLIQSAFGYYGVHIYLLNEKTGQLEYQGTQTRMPFEQVLAADSNSLNGKAARLNQAILVNDVSAEPSYRMDRNYPDTQSELVVPLHIGNRIIGTLDLLHAERDYFQPGDVPVVQNLGDQIAIAIENARLYKHSRELAVLEERNRVARELHDAMNQSLYSVILFIGAARNDAVNSGWEPILGHLARAEEMAQRALKEMRLMVYELRPIELEQKGFIGALQQRLDAVEGRAGIDAELQADPSIALPPALEETIFRIVQEALNNVLKHAGATKVTIRVGIENDLLTVQVTDNGVGFDPAAPATSKGIGLAGMRERVNELGGRLEIRSEPGKGTCVGITVSLAQR